MRRLFYDIETSLALGAFWRPSWKARISYEQIIHHARVICISYAWESDLIDARDKARQDGDDEFEAMEGAVKTLRWNKGDDTIMLRKFAKVADKADEMIAHNGDRFDMKWLATRCVELGIDWNPYHQTYDTLKRCRGDFNFPSNRLNDVADYLGVPGKSKTEYDWWKLITVKAFIDRDFGAKYKKYMNLMDLYCDRDVVVLFLVWEIIAPAGKHHQHAGVLDGGEKYSCPHCGGTHIKNNKRRVTRTGIIKRQMYCYDCTKYYTISNKVYMEMVVDRMQMKIKN